MSFGSVVPAAPNAPTLLILQNTPVSKKKSASEIAAGGDINNFTDLVVGRWYKLISSDPIPYSNPTTEQKKWINELARVPHQLINKSAVGNTFFVSFKSVRFPNITYYLKTENFPEVENSKFADLTTTLINNSALQGGSHKKNSTKSRKLKRRKSGKSRKGKGRK